MIPPRPLLARVAHIARTLATTGRRTWYVLKSPAPDITRPGGPHDVKLGKIRLTRSYTRSTSKLATGPTSEFHNSPT
ncbi:hypothetical protein NPX13_g7026 [Xylaria arbuscula]|uniref:Uncharacterized protein n=1 Tax=Xylaria arbuscula TaxID=114810 RepID=A0A9W8NAR9_9PEZI|nr:hypothetical protein NPX13_g7026 [Xylaria arbuscula]